MRLHFTLIMIASLILSNTSFSKDLFLHALSLVARGKKKEAYTELESVFYRAENKTDKARASLLLSYASNSDLKRSKRHFYAEYFIHNYKATKDDATQINLQLCSAYRIAGDGFFDEADLNKSKTYYSMLSTCPDPEDVDYSNYKLGWVDLNKGDATAAFEKWFQRIKIRRSDRQALRDALIRDLGRSWVEATSKSSIPASKVGELKFSSLEKEKFIDGIVLSVRRIKNTVELEKFRHLIENTEYTKPVFSKILAQGSLIGSEPCTILDWIEKLNLDNKSENKDVFFTLSRCFSESYKKTEHQDLTELAKKIISVSSKIELHGTDRWARAELYREVSQHARACDEFTEMNSEQLAANNEKIDDKALSSMIASCQQMTGNDKKALSEKMAGLFILLAEKKKLDRLPTNKLYTLLNVFVAEANFRNKLNSDILSHENLYKETYIPLAMCSTMTDKERTENGSYYLTHFAPKPLVQNKDSLKNEKEIWIEILKAQLKDLAKNNSFKEGANLLNQYTPNKSEYSKLWAYWVLLLPEDFLNKSENVVYKNQAQEVSLELIGNSKRFQDPKIADTNLKLATALKVGDFNSFWGRLGETNSLEIEPAIRNQFFISTLPAIEEGKVSLTLLDKSVEGRAINCVSKVISEIKLNPSGCSKEFDWIAKNINQYKDISFFNDVLFLKDFEQKNEGKKNLKLSFDLKLPKKIESRFNQISDQIKNLKKKQWSHRSFSMISKKIVLEDCDSFISDLENLKNNKKLQDASLKEFLAQIDNILGLVKSWEVTLVKDAT